MDNDMELRFEYMDSSDRIQLVRDLHDLNLPMSVAERRLFSEFHRK